VKTNEKRWTGNNRSRTEYSIFVKENAYSNAGNRKINEAYISGLGILETFLDKTKK